MDIKTLFEVIDLQKEIINKVNVFLTAFKIETLSQEILDLTDNKLAYSTYEKLANMFKDDKENIALLSIYLLSLLKTYDKYKQENISDEIFIDTMKCFKRFIDECYIKNNEYFFDRAWWTHKQSSMIIFRIKELEYEFIDDLKIISIHIPSDAKLTKSNIINSLNCLKEFVKQHKKEYIDCKIICDSWLLSNKLKDLLSKDSNILTFQSFFDIYKVNDESDDCYEWIFKKASKIEYYLLPEKTSLQKKSKRINDERKAFRKCCRSIEENLILV